MHLSIFLSTALALVAAAAKQSDCAPFLSSEIEFTSDFKQPEPPMIKHDFTASFIQHKW
jgi:hypothetical protein